MLIESFQVFLNLATGGYVADTQAPSLVSSTLDMNASTITMRFDDVVDVTTILPRYASLQSAATEMRYS